MPPVVDRRGALAIVGAGEYALMFADDLPLGGDDDALRIDPHADRAVGERRRHAVAIALQVDEAGRRDTRGTRERSPFNASYSRRRQMAGFAKCSRGNHVLTSVRIARPSA